MSSPPRPPLCSVVIATRDRRATLLESLDRLTRLPDRPPIIVVDNGSSDGTGPAVRDAYPDVRVVELPENLGGGARNIGVRLAETPFVAFSDDDSWWAPGALSRAAAVLDAHPAVAVVAGRILVGPEERVDPVSLEMAASPLPPDPGLPGPLLLGFVACGAVVRAAAFLEVGGFDHRYGIGGEERLLCLDLAAAGWSVVYVEDVVAHHHPSPSRDHGRRRATEIRNDLWTTWRRRPLSTVLRSTFTTMRLALRDPAGRAGIREAIRGLSWVVRDRRVVPPPLERRLRLLSAS